MRNEFEQDDVPEVAGVIGAPPLIFAGALGVSLALGRFARARALPPQLQFIAPGFFVAAGLIGPRAFKTMGEAGTKVSPFEASTAVVQTGPFEYTRNPLYLSMALLYVAIALAARASFPLAVLPAVLWLMNVGVIEREERYLEAKFGETYREYKLRVPRWL